MARGSWLQIYPRQDIWERAPLEEFVSQLRQVDPEVTGFPVMSYESIPAIKNGYLEGGLYATAAILIVAFLTLRAWRATLLAMLPAGCGMLWVVGLMWLGRLTFNLANLVAVPITIGIGVESGIDPSVVPTRKAGQAGCWWGGVQASPWPCFR